MSQVNRVVFGRRAVQDLLGSNRAQVQEIFLRKGAKYSKDLLAALEKTKAPMNIVDDTALREMAHSVRHQGVVLTVKMTSPEFFSLSSLISLVGSKQRSTLVVCDQVEDPQNLGAIARASEVLGADGLIITANHSSPVSVAAKRVSAGALDLLPHLRVKNLNRCLSTLKDEGFWLIGLDVSADAVELSKIEQPDRVAIILGSEGKGLRRLTLEACDFVARIPMFGQVDSLNVAQAAAVALYERRR